MILHIPSRPTYNANGAAHPTRMLDISQVETVETGKTSEEDKRKLISNVLSFCTCLIKLMSTVTTNRAPEAQSLLYIDK